MERLEIIGETCRNVSLDFRKKYPKVEWKGIVGTRDKLIHDYMGVDLERVWMMVIKDVPVLKKQVEEILEAEE
jgi:uncharacterized protein with HEPN domain